VTTFGEKAKRKAHLGGHRDEDLALLRRLVDDSDVLDYERDAFAQMLRQLEASSSEGGYHALSEPRRLWAREVAERVGCIGYENLVSSGLVPRGREVATPAVLQNLPKKPPGRR
jgi:hypothetical protein